MRVTRTLARLAATATTTGLVFVGGMIATAPAQAWEVAVWDRVAQCESTGNWQINTGNGYYGGLQFSAGTWKAFGGQQYATNAHQATKAEQIAVARRVLHTQGPRAWPTCSVKAGLTRTNGGADANAQPAGGTSPERPPATKMTVDGVLNAPTIRAMQSWVGATPDGVWGSATTRALQAKVGARVDGVRGPETTRKVQAVVGAPVDGVWGSGTTRALQRHLNNIAV